MIFLHSRSHSKYKPLQSEKQSESDILALIFLHSRSHVTHKIFSNRTLNFYVVCPLIVRRRMLVLYPLRHLFLLSGLRFHSFTFRKIQIQEDRKVIAVAALVCWSLKSSERNIISGSIFSNFIFWNKSN